MTYKFGEQCPSYNWVKVGDMGCMNCEFCQGKVTDTSIDCDYSQIPNIPDPFKKGDMVYRIESFGGGNYWVKQSKVRTSKWCGNHWEYQFDREQHHYKGYATEKEAYEIVCRASIDHIKNRLAQLQKDLKKCGKTLDASDIKLLLEK